MYSSISIDQVREADIKKVVESYFPLKRAGSLWEATSPFSDDKTASFKVSEVKNNFVCYSSQNKGDAIKFVMLKDNCDFIEAVKKIAGICGIFLEEEAETEDQKKIKINKDQMLLLMGNVSKEYQKQLNNLPDDHWSKLMVADRDFSQETLVRFSIGYAPDDFKFVTSPIIEKGKFEIGKSTGLVCVKEGKSFDFFRNRLMFPIEDVNGNVVAFGARSSNEDQLEKKGPKYINSSESEIYSKSKILYGLFQAKNSIAKSQTAVLVEGYTDVTALHQHGCDIAVASGGTALSNDQAKLLQRFAKHIIIVRDNDGYDEQGNDKAGLKAALKDVDIFLTQGFKVSVVILPEGEDPDSFSRKQENIKQYIFDNAQLGVEWKATKLKNKAANDPDALSVAVDEISRMLYCIKDDVKRNLYTDTCRKILKQPIKVLKDKIDLITKESESKAEKQGVVKGSLADELGLPEGADFKEYMDHRYVTVQNTCFFRGRDGFFKGTNYKITPLFHVYGKQENKRLCEVINELGYKKLIDFDTSDFVSRQKFQEVLLNEGFFIEHENFAPNHFTLMKNRILSEFVMAYELKTLGWQKEGFFAYANCVYHNGNIKKVNQYGIVQLETGIENNSEYMEDIKHYYSPSFSEMYKHTRDNDDPYENDRYFVYKESPVAFHSWMKQMKSVYDKKAITGIAFVFATIFRDLYLKRYQFFPHLFLTGEKGSGKSKFGESLAALFTYKQEAFDLNSGTLVAFTRRMSRTSNALSMMEEYNDGVDDKIFQVLKGAYDGRGREMGKATGDNRTTTTKVNCSLIILSQYLSSRDDNSLTSRSIVEHFIKPSEMFTNEQIEEYSKLKAWEEEGLSSMLTDVLQHRELIEKEIHTTYAALNKQLKFELRNNEYQERMLQNYVALLTPMKILWEKFTFPFTYDEVFKQFKEAIVDSSDLIIESEGLAEFWRTLEYLLDRKPFSLITTGYQFIIDKPQSLSLQTRKGEKDHVWKNPDRKAVLMLRLNSVHQLYHKEVSSREGVEVISENTLRNYFKSKKYFIGSVKSYRFTDTSTSAYVFDYDMMHEGGVLNLTRNGTDNYEEVTAKPKEEEGDLPF